MSNKSEENVQDLLDSLDVKQGQKFKPKKSSTKRKENNKKAAGDDILQFLDELDTKKPDSETAKSGKPSQAQAEPKSETNQSETNAETNSETDAKPETNQPATEETTASTSTSTKGEDNIPSVADPVSTITSWWSRNKGGLWSKAQETIQDAVSDAMKQASEAEALIRDEQPHFSLNSIQNRLKSVLNTIVPPISRHEQLKIHIFHDMVGYPSVDKLLYEVFDYVMDQVEGGGDLNLVVQKGKERHRVGSDYDVHRALNFVQCSLQDAAKLAKANVDEIRSKKAAAASAAGGADSTASSSTETDETSENPNIRISEVYIAIQPVVSPNNLDSPLESTGESLYFVTYLADIEHNIELQTVSQALPYEWAQWLDNDGQGFTEAAIDPREWVFGWVEDALNLAFGVIAQRYVTTRMGLTNVGTQNVDAQDAE